MGKARGHDNISMRMIKMRCPAIFKPLAIIFNQYVDTGVFPSPCKKGNTVPIRKKGDKQIFKNYRQVSLLPICAKIIERLIFNEMFNFYCQTNMVLNQLTLA